MKRLDTLFSYSGLSPRGLPGCGIPAALTLGLILWIVMLPGCLREDSPGTEVAHEAPKRIICMAPNIAEAVFALGGGERVVGVSEYTTYPPEAAAKPNVGALYNANLERIVSLRPDLIIIQQKHEKVEKLCRDRNIPFLLVNMESGLDSVLTSLDILGETLDASERAKTLRMEIEKEVAAIRARVEGMARPRVLICVDRSKGSLKNIYCAGGGSFLNELSRIAGGENILADEADAYVQISTEAIVQRAPEVIIETLPGRDLSEAARREIIAEWAALDTLPAVKTARVYLLTEDYAVLPGPRIAKIARLLSKTLHPEATDAR